MGKGPEPQPFLESRLGNRDDHRAHENHLQLWLRPVQALKLAICVNCYEATEAHPQDFIFKIILINRYAVPREVAYANISR